MAEDNAETKEYFVLSHGFGILSPTNFKNYNQFTSLNTARAYALAHLPAIVASRNPALQQHQAELKNPNTPLIVVAPVFLDDGKRYYAQRCSVDAIDETVSELVGRREADGTAFVGVELKLI